MPPQIDQPTAITPPEEQTTGGMTADQAAAALAYATYLSEKMFGFNQAPTEPQTEEKPVEGTFQEPKTAPETTKTPESVEDTRVKEMETKLGDFDKKIHELRKEIKDDIKKEMEGIRKSIKEALNA